MAWNMVFLNLTDMMAEKIVRVFTQKDGYGIQNSSFTFCNSYGCLKNIHMMTALYFDEKRNC